MDDQVLDKIIIAAFSVLIFIGGRSIVTELTNEFSDFFSNFFTKSLIIFGVVYINTKDVLLSCIFVVLYHIIIQLLKNKEDIF